MEITELKQTAQDSFIISFSDGTSIKTVLSVVADYSLYSGRELSDEEDSAVVSASELGRAQGRALCIIGATPLRERGR